MMRYAKTDLSKIPHGSERTKNLRSVENIQRKLDIPCITITYGGANDLVDLAASLGLVGLYKNNVAINLIRNIYPGENSLLDFASSNSNKLVQDSKQNDNPI